MMALTFIAIVFLYLGAFIWAGIAARTWLARFQIWGLLSIPLILWLWDYPVIQYRHEQACAKDGGLRVLIPPDKTDRFQLDGKRFAKSAAEGLLREFYPKIKVVEAPIDSALSSDKYFAYSVDPSSVGPDKSKYVYIKTPLERPSSGLYILTESKQITTPGGQQIQTSLIRNGRIYAQWTSYNAVWNSTGILPNGWRCYFGNVYPDNELTKLLTN